MTFFFFSVCFQSKASLALRKWKPAQIRLNPEQLLICQVFHKQTCIYLLTRFTLEVNLPFEQQEIAIEIDTIYNQLFLLNIFYGPACLAHLSCRVFIYDKSSLCSFKPLLKILESNNFYLQLRRAVKEHFHYWQTRCLQHLQQGVNSYPAVWELWAHELITPF